LTLDPPLVRTHRVIQAAQMRMGDATQTNSQGVRRDTRMTLPINPWKLEVAAVNSGQTFADGPTTVVTWPTVNIDGINGFSSNAYTVGVSGEYIITSRFAVNTPAVANLIQTMFIALYVNAVERSRGQGGLYPQGAGGVITNLSSTIAGPILFLNAGDVLDIRYQQSFGGTGTQASSQTDSSYFALHLLSG
jgi:hypothetical protein